MARGRAQQLRALPILSEDLSVVPAPTSGSSQTSVTPTPHNSDTFDLPPKGTSTQVQVPIQNICMQINKNNKNKTAVVVLAFSPSTWEKEAGKSKFEVSLVYIAISRQNLLW